MARQNIMSDEIGIDGPETFPQNDPGMDGIDASRMLLPSAVGAITLPSEMVPDDLGEIYLEGEDEDFRPQVGPVEHGSNLAAHMSANDLAALESSLIFSVNADYDSGKRWRDDFRRGMTLMGLTDDIFKGPFNHASMAIHPMLGEACVRFWSRTMPELLPLKGPAKGLVNGKTTELKENAAERMANYINYQILKEDLGYRDETNKLIFQLPLRGCGFRKTRFDEEVDTIIGEYVSPDQLIGYYGLTSLRTAGRFTHRYPMAQHTLRQKQIAGVFLDIDIPEPGDRTDELLETQDVKDQASGVERNEDSNVDHIIDEIYVMLDLKGFEDMDDATGQPSGLALPYVVTIERESEKILSIYRDWRPQDPMRQRRRRFVQYSYLPGFGFYGLGLVALIGTLADQSSAIMRIITNGGAYNSIPGGFIAKDGRGPEGDYEMEPGKWKKVDASFEELSKAFFTPNFNEPSPTLFQMLTHGESISQRITSTTDIEVGQGNNNAPVGTTMALLEKAQEINNAIQINLHASLTEELEIRYEFTRDFIAPTKRSFMWDDAEEMQEIDEEVFDPQNTRIQPTSDPTQSSVTQRIASAQMTYQLATENPDVLDKKVAIRRMLRAGNISDMDELFIEEKPPERMDPITEGSALLMGKPIKVFEDQDHAAHIEVHRAFMQNQGFGGNKEVQEAIGAAMTAHLGEHLGFLYAQEARKLGVPVAAPNFEEEQEPLDPQMEADIAIRAAQVARQLQEIPGLPAEQGPDPEEVHKQKLRHNEELHQQKIKHKGEDYALDETARKAKLIDQQSTEALKRDNKITDFATAAAARAAEPKEQPKKGLPSE